MTGERRPAPFDYDDLNFRQGVAGRAMDYSIFQPEYRDIHPLIADRLSIAGAAPVLDIGCGPCVLGTLLDERGISWTGVDRSRARLTLGHGPRVLGDATTLPFLDGSFGAATAIYMLYHLEDPFDAVLEAYRVLRPGGLFAAAAPSRFDWEDFAPYMPLPPLDTFDSDMASELLGRIFEEIRSDTWDVYAYRLPDRRAVWAYLVGMQVPLDVAEDVAGKIPLPFWVRKRGAVVWGRKPG
jgi:SAM-dependent methyltransferase